MRNVLLSIRYTTSYFYNLLVHWNVEERRVRIGAADDAGCIVLLIPGLFATGGVMTALRGRLRKERIPAFVAETGFYSAMSLEKAARIVQEETLAIRERYPQATIHYVGHSLGGIVAYLAARNGSLEDPRSRIVTLGTPFDGTWAAALALALPAPIIAVAPVPPTLIPPLQRRRWRKDDGLRVRLPILSIAGERDVIVPPGRCRLHGARNVTLAGVDHAGLVMRKDVFLEILGFLDDEAVERRTIRPPAG